MDLEKKFFSFIHKLSDVREEIKRDLSNTNNTLTLKIDVDSEHASEGCCLNK